MDDIKPTRVTRLRRMRAALFTAILLFLFPSARALAAGDPDLNADIRSDDAKTMQMHREGVREINERERDEKKKRATQEKQDKAQQPAREERQAPSRDDRERRERP
jgi:hypothetical protein